MDSLQKRLSHPSFFNGYVSLTAHTEIPNLLRSSVFDLEQDLKVLKHIDLNFTYADGKWTIAQLLQHCIDAELIFTYRALSIARDDKRIIRSFDENDYATASKNTFVKEDLLETMLTSRKLTILLFNSFKEEWLDRQAPTEIGEKLSVRSLAHILVGHWLHHKAVLASKYGVQFKLD